jgi:hypothetical protein
MPQTDIAENPQHQLIHVACPGCDGPMALSLLEPGSDGQDVLTFKCQYCNCTTLRHATRPTSLKYRVAEDGNGWRWEVVAQDGRVIAHGSEGNEISATTAAMLQGIRSLQEATTPP